MPTHCSEHEVVGLSEEDSEVDTATRQQSNRRFRDRVGLMAWDRHAIGPTLLEQMKLVDAQQHKTVVAEKQICFSFSACVSSHARFTC